MPDLVTGFALVAIVLTIAGLASGFVDRAPLSFPIIFLGFGFLLGHHGLGILDIGAENTLLEPWRLSPWRWFCAWKPCV